jgi:prophage DNA circulation protein
MPAFTELQRMSFDGVAFPVEQVTVSGGLRDHVHEYPHASGGAPEKLGRKLYTIRADALFQTGFRAYGHTDLWPGALASLRAKFEREITGDLVIPTIGTISAYCVNWSQVANNKVLSGERVELEFREDQPDSFLTIELVKVSQTAIQDLTGGLVTIATDDGFEPDLFAAIQDAVNSITSVGDQIDLYNNLIQVKAAAIVDECNRLDASLDDLDQPIHWKTLYALHDVVAAAIKLQQDAAKRAIPIIAYTTPTAMTITDVSHALYGDNSQAITLLQMNGIVDPWQIPAGTVLQAYSKAA